MGCVSRILWHLQDREAVFLLKLWPALGRILAPYSEGTNIPMHARRSHACALVCLAIVSVAARPVRAAHRFVEYPACPGGKHANKAVVKGLVVAVQTLEDANEQKDISAPTLIVEGALLGKAKVGKWPAWSMGLQRNG
jgi:hypothetical protein